MRHTVLALTIALILAKPLPAAETVDAIAKDALALLPGKTAFLFAELDGREPQPLWSIHADERLAVGSSFKLYIFGALADEVNDGRRRLDNTMLLSADLVGPPSSELAEWPIGSPVTLNTLTLKMISISDNTATDHLLHLLSRTRVERQMRAMGHGDPAVNTPLLSTRDMVLLRDKAAGMPGREYAKLDVAAKRAFLRQRESGPPNYDKMDFDAAAFDLAEWYASPMDMARALNWIQRHTRPDQPAHAMLPILTVDPKLSHDSQQWSYVGFKGGSEDQLIAGNWLLRNRNGRWYTLHVFCNSPHEKIAPEKMIAAVEKILVAVQANLEARAH